MRALRFLTGTRRMLLLVALLCVLLARVAVPAGWMPMADAAGRLVLAPCSGMGAMAVAKPAAHDMHMPGMEMRGGADTDEKRHPDPGGDHPCSGAGVTVALDTPVVALAAAVVPRPTTAFAPAVPRVFVGRGLAAPPPPQTGPPILV